MKIRESCLPLGWHPREPQEVKRFLAEWGGVQGTARAVIAPHAGWSYSGRISAKAISSLDRNIGTVAVVGGHLPPGRPPLLAMEDEVRTPLGNMAVNAGLRSAMRGKMGCQEDRMRDNTVEALLPMARFFFPSASLLWLRLPAEISSFYAGKTIAELAEEQGCRLGLIASTDLTHYGGNYDFSPQGFGPEALRWVKEVNDRRFIEAVIQGDPQEVLERAEEDGSSCSAGAVLCAMGFASACGQGAAKLLEYGTSADSSEAVPDSFVGYAAMAFAGGA